jgi:hypothetical protein
LADAVERPTAGRQNAWRVGERRLSPLPLRTSQPAKPRPPTRFWRAAAGGRGKRANGAFHKADERETTKVRRDSATAKQKRQGANSLLVKTSCL